LSALLWLRRDLRVRDHPALRAALDAADVVVPVFCFDPGLLGGRHASGPRTQVPDEYLSEPWTMPREIQEATGCLIGGDYPGPIVDHPSARREALARYAAASGS
jgi:deoxyribodipyrimidine photolyase